MASLNQIAYDLLSIVRPHLSDDSDIDLRQIKFWINNQRSLWVRNELNKRRSIDADITQTLCAELETVDASDCCGIDLGCDILRTKKKIPITLEMHNKEAIVRVGPVNKTKKGFSYVPYERIPWAANGRFNKNNIYAFLHDGYIFVYTKNPAYQYMKNITVRGVFEDPTAVADFNDCDTGTACYSDDDPYPIKNWMIPSLKEAILKSNLLITAQAEQQPSDDANNAKADTKNK